MDLQSEQPLQIQDEISLKEIIKILLDNKWLIAIITAVAVLLAGIYSYLIADPVYRSKAVLNASPIVTETVAENDIASIVNNTDFYPVSTIETYIEQLTSPQLLTRVINDLELTKADGSRKSIAGLRDMIAVSNVKDTNLIEITVTSSDKAETQKIANDLAGAFITYIDETGKAQSMDAASKINKQLLVEEENLAAKSQALADFMAGNASISELKSEIDSLIIQITNIKSEINDLEVAIKTNKDKLNTLKPQLKSTDYVIESLELDKFGDVVGENISITKIDDSALGSSLISIEFVNTQNLYIDNVARYNALKVKLDELEKVLVEKQALLVEEEYKYDRLDREVALAKQTYTAYQERYQLAVVATAAEIGSNNIVISSEAIEPERPTGPNKMLNLAISLVLGLMLGVFIGFFRSYWKTA